MPELPVKERRLPELHLPEISRQEIMRTLSEVRRPDLDPSDDEAAAGEPILRRMPAIRIDRAAMDAAMAALPRLVAPTIETARTMARTVTPMRLGRPRVGRVGWGLLAGVAVSATIAGIVLARDRSARERIRVTARGVVERVSSLRSQDDLLEVDPDMIAPELDAQPAIDSPASEWAVVPESGVSMEDESIEESAVAPT